MKIQLERRFVSKQKWTANEFKMSSKKRRKQSKLKMSASASRKRKNLKSLSKRLGARNNWPYRSGSVFSKRQNFQHALRQRLWRLWKQNFKRRWSPNLSNKDWRLKD